VIERNDQFYQVDRLRDLPDLLHRAESEQLTRPRRVSQLTRMTPVRLPVVATNLLSINQWPEPAYLLSSNSAPLFNSETLSELQNRLTMAAPEPPAEAPPALIKIAPPKPQQVREGLLRGRAQVKVNPVYPTSAKTLDVFFRTVVVAIVVSEEGRVISAKVVRGHPMLHAAAIEAAQKWVFEPTTLNGRPVKVESILTFVLDNLND
jgi:TonB family protein